MPRGESFWNPYRWVAGVARVGAAGPAVVPSPLAGLRRPDGLHADRADAVPHQRRRWRVHPEQADAPAVHPGHVAQGGDPHPGGAGGQRLRAVPEVVGGPEAPPGGGGGGERPLAETGQGGADVRPPGSQPGVRRAGAIQRRPSHRQSAGRSGMQDCGRPAEADAPAVLPRRGPSQAVPPPVRRREPDAAAPRHHADEHGAAAAARRGLHVPRRFRQPAQRRAESAAVLPGAGRGRDGDAEQGGRGRRRPCDAARPTAPQDGPRQAARRRQRPHPHRPAGVAHGPGGSLPGPAVAGAFGGRGVAEGAFGADKGVPPAARRHDAAPARC